jgi:Flp pilus assembly protein TadD
MSRVSQKPQSSTCDPVADCLNRARRQRLRGDQRKSLLLLREACCLAEHEPRLWTLYAVQCWRMGQRDEARKALRHALWQRERMQDKARAYVLRGLLLAMESAVAPELLRAA